MGHRWDINKTSYYLIRYIPSRGFRYNCLPFKGFSPLRLCLLINLYRVLTKTTREVLSRKVLYNIAYY